MTTIDDVFHVEYGNKLDMNKMEQASKNDGVAFVGRRGGLNGTSGVSGYVSAIPGEKVYPAGAITVALGGSKLLSSYVQQRPFYTAQNVAVLTPRDQNMLLEHRLYYAMCIRHNAFLYSAFGREANRTLGSIALPDDLPPWVATTPIPTHSGLGAAAGAAVQWTNPTSPGWRDFRLGDLFDIKKGKRLTKAMRTPGATRFIGASEKNNGVTDLNDVDPIFPAGCLTVVYNGNSVGYAFYQDQPFFACDDVNVLLPRTEMSRWTQLFIAAVIKHGRNRFTYGYKWTLARMKKTTVRLPIDAAGDPDWQFMESAMRSLPFSAAAKDEGMASVA